MKYSLSIRLTFYLVGILLSCTAAPRISDAAILQKDLQVLLRTLSFAQPSPSGRVNLSVIYDPAISSATADAQDISRLLEGGMAGKKMTLFARLVPVSALGTLGKNDPVFVTGGMQPHLGRIAAHLQGNQALSFSMDRACLENNCCSVHFSANNKVEITVNRAVLAARKITFDPIFLMMVSAL